MAWTFHELLMDASILMLVTFALFYLRLRREHRLPLPPSPNPDPIIGHLRSLPTSNEHQVYAKLSEELNSDIISLTILGQTIVVLNSAKAAHELLDRRSAIYSDRSELPMISDPNLIDWSRITGLLRYGERWRSQRRMTHALLHKKASEQFWPLTVKQSRLTMQRLLKNPDNFFKELRRQSGTILLSAVYGYEVTSAHDPLVEVVESALNHLCEAAVPGNFFVNTMPWLRFFPDWFPGTAWKQTVKEWRVERDEMVDVPFNWTKEQIAQGKASASVLKTLLTEAENNTDIVHDLAEEMDRIKWTAGTLFGAGADTTAASALVFVLAMTLYPDVQIRAQEELDRIIGIDRLPEMNDRPSLPYLECVLKEVLRWQSVIPLGIPHACMQDDEYRGYRIPKGAIVMGNTWAISTNNSVYANPETFDPNRFLDPLVPNAPAFGFGRRSCPGVHMAESTLFITMSSLLAIFDISPTRDDQGDIILPSIKMKSNALVSHPAEFKCSIKPRSQRAIELINALI